MRAVTATAMMIVTTLTAAMVASGKALLCELVSVTVGPGLLGTAGSGEVTASVTVGPGLLDTAGSVEVTASVCVVLRTLSVGVVGIGAVGRVFVHFTSR